MSGSKPTSINQELLSLLASLATPLLLRNVTNSPALLLFFYSKVLLLRLRDCSAPGRWRPWERFKHRTNLPFPPSDRNVPSWSALIYQRAPIPVATLEGFERPAPVRLALPRVLVTTKHQLEHHCVF